MTVTDEVSTPPAVMVTVEIENSYTDGHESTVTVEVPAPQDPTDLQEWWEEVVWEHTGDGHYTEVYEATGERLGSCYEATIVKADDESLVNQCHEWLD